MKLALAAIGGAAIVNTADDRNPVPSAGPSAPTTIGGVLAFASTGQVVEGETIGVALAPAVDIRIQWAAQHPAERISLAGASSTTVRVPAAAKRARFEVTGYVRATTVPETDPGVVEFGVTVASVAAAAFATAADTFAYAGVDPTWNPQAGHMSVTMMSGWQELVQLDPEAPVPHEIYVGAYASQADLVSFVGATLVVHWDDVDLAEDF